MSIARVKTGQHLLVLGGGLSGLSYVHYLRNFLTAYEKRSIIKKVTLIEANDYMGGSVKTRLYEDGMVHELGPRSIRVTNNHRSRNTALLVEELGLTNDITTMGSKSAGSKRYIYLQGKPMNFSIGLKNLFHTIPGSEKTFFSALFRDLFKAKSIDLTKYQYEDPSIYEFVCHRFGNDIAENLLDPLFRGITSGDVRKLSTKAFFSDLLALEQVHGSVVRSMFKPGPVMRAHDKLFGEDLLNSQLVKKFVKEKVTSFTLKSGLQTIPEHLSNSLLNTNDDGLIEMYNQTILTNLRFDPDEDGRPCCATVRTVEGDLVEIKADHVVAAIPSKDLAKTISKDSPQEHLNALEYPMNIPHNPVGVVVVEYRDVDRKKLKNIMNSFGILTHSKAGSRLLGIAMDSASFPEVDAPIDGVFRLSCMMGGMSAKEVFGSETMESVQNSQMESIALEEITKIIGFKKEPHRMSTYLWDTGIAQYHPGHQVKLKDTRDHIKKLNLPLTLIGQSYDGVAVNDVIFTARRAAHDFVLSL